MPEFKFTFNVKANSKEEAMEIVKALQIVYQKVSKEDLVKLSNAINKKPGLVKKALKFI